MSRPQIVDHLFCCGIRGKETAVTRMGNADLEMNSGRSLDFAPSFVSDLSKVREWNQR
ncbi:MAG: hypothetical protein AAFR31_04695 [Cyanobacteria bacterium J06627_8]